jgi:predicted metal-dependent hydrolase
MQHRAQDPRHLTAGGRTFLVDVARHPRARRYVLRVTPEGRLRLTVPRGASIAGGVAFASRQHDWIVREWRRLERAAAGWAGGTEFWYRGQKVRLAVTDDVAAFADCVVPIGTGAVDVRRAIERHLMSAAAAELPDRARSLAEARGVRVTGVTVGNQRSRWGSCSPRGAVALNWRLIQMPADVADYVILHELAHRRHPNHSDRYWREVEVLCPWWRRAERWLRTHGKELFVLAAGILGSGLVA